MKLSGRWASLTIIAVAILLFPWLVLGAQRTVASNSNRLSDWLPADLEETRQLQDFNRWFGDGAFVMVSWEGCRIDLSKSGSDASADDPRIEKFINALKASDSKGYFRSVRSTRSLLATMSEPPLDIDFRSAASRLYGSVLGKDGNACVLIVLNEIPTEQMRDVIGYRHVRWIDRNLPAGKILAALQTAGVDLDQAHMGGPPVDNLAINEEGQRTLVRLALAAGALGIVLAYISLRSARLTGIVLACGVMATFGATAAIWATGSHADAIVLAMPSLVYVLSISGAIHLINYYRAAVQQSGVPGAAWKSIRAGYKPALLCNTTTALGLLSLLTSDLTPIRHFGLYSALGMAWMLVVLFAVLPAALEVFGGVDGFGMAKSLAPSSPNRNSRRLAFSSLERCSASFARATIRHYRIVCYGGLAILVGLAAGLPRTRTSVDLLKLFDDRTQIIADYRWLQSHLGNLVPLEVLVRFDRDVLKGPQATASKHSQQLSTYERAVVVDRVQQEIETVFGSSGQQIISKQVSTLTFLPPLNPEARGVSSIIRRTVIGSQIEKNRQAIESSGYLRTDSRSGDELWRISLRVAAFKDVELTEFVSQLKDTVKPVLTSTNATIAGQDAEPISAIYTGAIPVVHQAQRTLLTSLIESTMWSFLTITPLLMFVTRGIRSGMIAMLPNLLPVLAIFGTMGWLGISVDIGCMMTASIALGVAVDDTIHFLFWYRHAHARSTAVAPQSQREQAIVSAYRSCFAPTLQAALINGLGLSVFFLSTFVPTRQFGILMLVILSFGAIAELVLLPAILASPLGRVFDRSGGKQVKSGSAQRCAGPQLIPMDGELVTK